MAIILPIFCFLSLFITLISKSTQSDTSKRTFFLLTVIILSTFILITTEVLSLFNAINYTGIIICWLLASLGSILILIKNFNWKNIRKACQFPKFTAIEIILMIFLLIIISITATIALTSPPNNYDSMTYHMSRVANWIQHQNIKGYPTQVERQLWANPFAEFIILHFQILSKSDRFANMVQWLAMLGCLIGSTLIAKQLGSNRLGQICAAIFTATIPMGILQSTNTKSSIVLSLFLLCFIHFMLLIRTHKHWTNYAALGASLGLCILTKGTGYIYILPFLIWLILSHITFISKKTIALLLLTAAIAISINIGHYSRNYQLGKHILSPVKESKTHGNTEMSPTLFTSNLVRNAALHCGTPWKNINKHIHSGVENIHKALKLDISDPRISYINLKFTLPVLAFHEDHAGNPVHFILILLGIPLLFMRHNNISKKTSIIYLCATCATFLLFCFLLQWQPWHSRLHLPFFILCAPFVAASLRTKNNNKTIFIICLILILCAFPWLFKNSSRPILNDQNIFNVERNQAYFFNRPDYLGPFQSIANYLEASGCHDIGLDLHGEVWEYPFWPLFKDKLKTFRIRRINVNNQTAKLKTQINDDFIPCATLGFKKETNIETYENQSFVRTQYFHPLSLYIADTNGTLRHQNLTQHFVNRMQLDNQANAILKTINQNKNSQQAIVKYMNIRKAELAQAKLVDIQYLNILLPSFGDQFETKLLKGLQIRLSGYASGNPSQQKAGIQLINEWNAWMQQNKNAVKKVFGAN